MANSKVQTDNSSLCHKKHHENAEQDLHALAEGPPIEEAGQYSNLLLTALCCRGLCKLDV